jgi:cytochrome c551/c552
MEDEFAVVEKFTGESLAYVAKSFLEANGIPAFLSRDDCGGMRPWMSIVFPIRLMVSSSDLQEAQELLRRKKDEKNS